MTTTALASAHDATPWYFRWRIALFFAIYGASAALDYVLAPIAPFPRLVGVLSLPREALEGSTAPVAEHFPAILLPVALCIVGAAIRVWGTSYLSGSVMSDESLHADRLIVKGPFRYVRNPLYLGNMLFSLAFGLIFAPPALVVVVILSLALCLALIRGEESALARTHPDAFRAYAARVPRLLPRLTPVTDLASADARPDWWNGIASEAWLFGLFGGGILSTIDWRLGWTIWGLGVVALVALRVVSRRRPS
ncbi:MAG: methyltransferase family protein [Thermoplasmatota archaeon]